MAKPSEGGATGAEEEGSPSNATGIWGWWLWTSGRRGGTSTSHSTSCKVLTLFSLLCFLPILPGDCACSGSGIGELFDCRGFWGGWFLGKWWRKTAFRHRDLPTYGVLSLLIRGLRLTRVNVGGSAPRWEGVAGDGLCFAQNLSGCGLPVRPLRRLKTTAALAPIPYDPDVATDYSSWSVVQAERVKSLPPGCWGSSLGFRFMRTPLTDFPPVGNRHFSRRLFYPLSLIFRARTLSPFGIPFPFPSPPLKNFPHTLLPYFSPFALRRLGSFLRLCPFLLLVIAYVGFVWSSRRIVDD